MRNEFTAIFELDDNGVESRYVAYCVEISGARAEGKTIDEARDKLAEAIKSELKVRREETKRDILFNVEGDTTSEVIAVQETISLY